MINIESLFSFIGYLNTFWQDSNACSHLHSALYIYGSKVGAHYRSTLFADLKLEITVIRYLLLKNNIDLALKTRFPIVFFAHWW